MLPVVVEVRLPAQQQQVRHPQQQDLRLSSLQWLLQQHQPSSFQQQQQQPRPVGLLRPLQVQLQPLQVR